jgi:hypothetical protein
MGVSSIRTFELTPMMNGKAFKAANKAARIIDAFYAFTGSYAIESVIPAHVGQIET